MTAVGARPAPTCPFAPIELDVYAFADIPTRKETAVLATDIRRSEWGSEIPTHLVRDFIYAAVRHPAVAAFVKEYVFDAIATGEEPQSDIAEALRVAIDEILNAATAENWEQVGRDLIAWARDFLEPALNEGAASTPWPFPPDANVARRRKPPVKVDQDAILAWMHERPSAMLREIAQHFNISAHSARCKADGLAAQGKLNVTPGSLSPPTPRRYSVPAPPSPPDRAARQP